jgi:hypothetical protein
MQSSCCELPLAILEHVLAEAQEEIARQESLQDLLALKQRICADILAAHE